MLGSTYMKCLALSGLLGLFATILGALGDFHVFAQITPAPEKYAGDNNDLTSSNNPSNDGDDGGTGSGSSKPSSSNDDSDTESSEEEQDTFVEKSSGSDSSETERLMRQIINKVNRDFAAVGLPSFGW
jgi:hypothetical protein